MKNLELSKIFLLKMLFFGVFLLFFVPVSAQENQEEAVNNSKKFMQEAEEALAENNFPLAEANYRQAIAKDPNNATARYNLGNLYYNQKIASEAVERHSQAGNIASEKSMKHNSFHNQGNAFMEQEKYQEAVEAYKDALRNNPEDDQTRYNLALAKKMLEEQEQEGGGGENDDQDQDQENQDQQEQDQGDQQEQNEGEDNESQDQEEGDDEESEGEPQSEEEQEENADQGEEEQPQQQQPIPGQLSPQQIENLLEAMGKEEEKVRDKINAEKAKGTKVKSEKDW